MLEIDISNNAIDANVQIFEYLSSLHAIGPKAYQLTDSLTVEQVATEMGCSARTVLGLIKSGDLAARDITPASRNRSYRILFANYLDYMATGRTIKSVAPDAQPVRKVFRQSAAANRKASEGLKGFSDRFK